MRVFLLKMVKYPHWGGYFTIFKSVRDAGVTN